MRRVGIALAALMAAALLLIAYMVWLASSAPVERHLAVHVADWPAGAPPMRLVLLSDLHVATPGDSPARLAATVAQVNALRPDLVLIAGDFRSTESYLMRPAPLDEALAPLAGLRARLGTIAVLGNHDFGGHPHMRQHLAAVGIPLLRNAAARRGPLAILGFDDPETGHVRVEKTIASWRAIGGVPLALAHGPDVIPQLPAGIDLVLVGHTHCGQVVLPFAGALFTASGTGHRYVCGIVREGARTTVVTGGLGTSNLPIRLGAPPDFWVIDIGR